MIAIFFGELIDDDFDGKKGFSADGPIHRLLVGSDLLVPFLQKHTSNSDGIDDGRHFPVETNCPAISFLFWPEF